jgi:sugar/nucleoside kinase (ribokinase family)
VLGLLTQRGVDAARVVRDPDTPTSASIVLVDAAGERTFLHMPGANATLSAADVGEAAFAGRALHVGGALVLDALDGEPTAALLAEARSRGIQTSLDPVHDPRGRWQLLLPALPNCDLVTPSLGEAAALTGEDDPARAARRLHELGAGIAAVTLGPDGCHVVGDGVDAHVPAPQVDAVDGTGAGDAFAAAFLAALLAGEPPLECAHRANAAGAEVVTVLGAL